MPFTENPPQLPPADIPVVNANGTMTPQWREFWQRLLQYLERLRASIP